jgi:hypothetical protein
MLREVGEAVAHQSRPTFAPWQSRRRRREQPRIEAQARDHGGDRTHRVAQLQGGVGAVAHHDERAVGLPPVHLSNHLTRPGGEGLEAPAASPRRALGGGEHREER